MDGTCCRLSLQCLEGPSAGGNWEGDPHCGAGSLLGSAPFPAGSDQGRGQHRRAIHRLLQAHSAVPAAAGGKRDRGEDCGADGAPPDPCRPQPRAAGQASRGAVSRALRLELKVLTGLPTISAHTPCMLWAPCTAACSVAWKPCAQLLHWTTMSLSFAVAVVLARRRDVVPHRHTQDRLADANSHVSTAYSSGSPICCSCKSWLAKTSKTGVHPDMLSAVLQHPV